MEYIVDTNVLLDYPKILEDNINCVITLSIIKEIDGLKKNPSDELRFNCRRASHAINKQKEKINFLFKQNKKLSTDDEIVYFAKKYGYGIVTNDLNLSIIAYKNKIVCQGYSNEGEYHTGIKTLFATFDKDGHNDNIYNIISTLTPPFPMTNNEFLVIKDDNTKETYCILKCIDNKLEVIPSSKAIRSKWVDKILPRNPEQQCLFNILHDENVKILLAQGKYGSGKSLCLTSYALQQLEQGKISKIVWVPNNSFNDNSREIAALPGDLFEKELPFLGTLIDLMGEAGVIQKLEVGEIEIVPISIMRGRNFKNSIVLVNEAQNLTEEHIKLLVGRCADGTRIFFDGDIKQVDSNIFKNKSGLKLLLNLAKSDVYSKIFGVATLSTIERSFAASASDYLDNIN